MTTNLAIKPTAKIEKPLPPEAGVKLGPVTDSSNPPKIVPPFGYGTIIHNSPELELTAKKVLGNEYGTRVPFTVGQYRYLARIEPHPPRGVIKEWHKGVTVYEAKQKESSANWWITTGLLFGVGMGLAYGVTKVIK